MGLFSKFEFGKKSEASGNGGWDSLGKEVPFQQEQEREQANTERQQRKIIASMMYGTEWLNVPDVKLPDGAEDDFLEKLSDGEIDVNAEKNLLNSIKGPVRAYGVTKVNERLGADKHLRRILGYAVAGDAGFNDPALVLNEGAVSAFEKFFPTPIDFENIRESFLQKIQFTNNDAKYHEYVQDMDKFQNVLYGKKYEYYKSLQGLKLKSHDMFSGVTESGGMLEDCTDAEKALMLKNAVIDGDDFIYQGKNFKLTPDMLKNVGLSPERKTMLGDMEIGLSGCFSVGGRDTIIGYVKSDDGYKVRGYYRSNSQGVWRYLPDYVPGENGNLAWYGKGYAEEMLTLPCEMQVALSKAAEKARVPVEQKTLPSFILAGTAKSWPDKATYIQAMHARALKGDLYRETAATPEVDFGKVSTIKQAPEAVSITGLVQPNYGKELMSWGSEAKIYGRLKNRVFESYDKKLKYVISEDTSGRCFVSSIETSSKPTSCGTRSEWVSGGDVETPLYEYPKQADNYGDTGDIRGRYQGMWKNYVSKMKIIQDYLATKK